MQNQKGFTLVELIICLVIVAALGWVAMGLIIPEAHGSMLVNTVMTTTDTEIAEIAAVVNVTPLTEVVVLVYAKEWTHDNVDTLMDQYRGLLQRLLSAGISSDNIVLNLANEGGLKEDQSIDRIPTIDGVYLYIQ